MTVISRTGGISLWLCPKSCKTVNTKLKIDYLRTNFNEIITSDRCMLRGQATIRASVSSYGNVAIICSMRRPARSLSVCFTVFNWHSFLFIQTFWFLFVFSQTWLNLFYILQSVLFWMVLKDLMFGNVHNM